MLQEDYELTPTQVAQALTTTVLRPVLEGNVPMPAALRTMDRVDSAVGAGARLVIRIGAAGFVVAIGALLAMNPATRTWGIVAIVASPLVYFAVAMIQGGLRRVWGAWNRTTDSWILMAGERDVVRKIENGKLPTVSGRVRAVLDGDRLTLRASDRSVEIPSVHAAWKARTEEHLVLAPKEPGIRPDFAAFAILPLRGEVARTLEAGA